jgi:hypothetical protein
MGEPLAKVLMVAPQGSAMGDFGSYCVKKPGQSNLRSHFFPISDGLLPHRLFSCSLTISNQ